VSVFTYALDRLDGSVEGPGQAGNCAARLLEQLVRAQIGIKRRYREQWAMAETVDLKKWL